MIAKHLKATKNNTVLDPGKSTLQHNRKRSNTLSSLKRKNLRLANQMTQFLKKTELTPDQLYHMNRLRKEVTRCANLTLYRDSGSNTDLKLISSFFCSCKLCFVCNQNRQKATRRKYWKWFGANAEVVEIKDPKTLKIRYSTHAQHQRKYAHFELLEKHGYDVMHLTLTVPHSLDHGFNDDHFYFEKLGKMFWLMRKDPYWNKSVFGGEYGIETTRSENGLHIHIHSLLLVKQEEQSRNKLHKMVLKFWNKYSVNNYSTREILEDTVLQKIMKSNSLLTYKDVSSLNPKGSTMINLEVIYSIEGGKKVRSTEFNSKTMLIGVMEAISYHFEPQAFDKQSHEFDFQLMADIMPVIYKKALYKKFGCLHGEKELNITFKEETDLVEDYEEVSSMVDRDTGEVLQDSNFYIINPAYVFHHADKDFKPILNGEGKKNMICLDALTTREAVGIMSELVKSEHKNKRKY